ncbi:MAG: hypothetical protein WDO17_02760 [Alphaproteobacteria bacterium]
MLLDDGLRHFTARLGSEATLIASRSIRFGCAAHLKTIDSAPAFDGNGRPA